MTAFPVTVATVAARVAFRCYQEFNAHRRDGARPFTRRICDRGSSREIVRQFIDYTVSKVLIHSLDARPRRRWPINN